MRDEACAAFLRWSLPRLGLRWAGYRRVHRTVCKRLRRRLRELGLEDLTAYRALLERDRGEWSRLEAMCRIPISRFYRDRPVFDALARDVLPARARAVLAEGGAELRCWSAGCASGEEPYTLAMIGAFALRAALRLSVIATDADPTMIARAAAGCYDRGSLRELPSDWIPRAFARCGDLFCVRDELRGDVAFRLEDIRERAPRGPFDLILCRNAVFTYWDLETQRAVLARVIEALAPSGALVLGRREVLPKDAEGLRSLGAASPIHLRNADRSVPFRDTTEPARR